VAVSDWRLTYSGFDPAAEGHRETLCTLGNGYFATRGAAPEAHADGVHYPGTYVAGVYNRLATDLAGRHVENESLVNVPNWLTLTFRVGDGPWFGDPGTEILSQDLELNLERGVLTRVARLQDPDGHVVAVTQRRFVSMRDEHLAALETTLVAENWSGILEVQSGLDGTVRNEGVERYRPLDSVHLRVCDTGEVDGQVIWILAETTQSHIRVAEAARTEVFCHQQRLDLQPTLVEGDGFVAHRFDLQLDQGSQIRVEKVVSLFTSRDPAISEPGEEARRSLTQALDYDALLDRHLVSWRHLWDRAHFELGTDGVVAMSLHLDIFHLLQTVSNNTVPLDVGVPARGIHGEAYRGHIFWDELFIVPFLSVRFPQISRALLLYRFRRLNAARRLASDAGYRGAMYPWQSGSSGYEETQTAHLNPVSGRWTTDASSLQHHINAAIVYNVWQYYQASGDLDFLRFYGAEMILEVARFWASIATYSHATDRYEIRGVVGPDEYHDGYPDRESLGIDNNAYTNLMAVWCLERAFHTLEILSPATTLELKERLGLGPEELAHWQDVSRKMRVCFHADVISQFEGFENLAELDWEKYRTEYGDIARMDRILEAEGDTANRYRLTKQADVTMLFYLLSSEEVLGLLERLGYSCDEELPDRCISYYEARTTNGSTLSRVVEAWIHARRDPERAWAPFLEALQSDLGDGAETTKEGIHLGAMAGTVDLLQRGFTGLETRGDELRVTPMIPSELGSLAFNIRYRGQLLSLAFSTANLEVRADPTDGEPITLVVHGRSVLLEPGHTVELSLSDDLAPEPRRRRPGRPARRSPRSLLRASPSSSVRRGRRSPRPPDQASST
jgi:trehalose/maltose hydrolase-like predicted phosphorylase